MGNQDFLNILKIESDEIESAFLKASISGKGTSQEIADFREAFVQQFLSRYFPFPFRITKGKIRDSFGNISASIDCVVLGPSHPHTVDSAGKHTLIFCDGVESAIEVKPDLRSVNELERGLAQITSVKALRRFKSSVLDLSVSPVDPEYKKLSYQIPSFIFATKCKTDPLDTAKEVKDYYAKTGLPLEQQIDAIVINKIGIIFNYKTPLFGPLNNVTQQREKGLFFEAWGENTLARFLFFLNQLPGAEMKMSEAIIPKYLAPFPEGKIVKV